jgi:hypothetical protein
MLCPRPRPNGEMMERVSNFIPLEGRAPGKAGYLVAVNADAIDFVSSAFSDVRQETVLRLHTGSGAIVEVAGEEAIEDTLDRLGLSGVEWQLRLEKLESRDA